MKARVKSTRGTSFAPSFAPQRSPAVPQHEEEPASMDAPAPLGSGHDFGQIRVHAGTRGGQAAQRVPESCPLGLSTPRSCPFGGACHTCPAPVQAKLTVNRPGDEYEQEADRVADQVMRMPEPLVQRQEEEPKEEVPEEEEEEEPVQASPLDSARLQRQEEGPEEEEEPIQTKPAGAERVVRREAECEDCEGEPEAGLVQATLASGRAPLVGPRVEGEIQNLRGGGEPLTQSARGFFEPRFGREFGQVRVHTGARAAGAARAVGAKAFTVGSDVVFGAGQYAPETSGGRRLMAHELTHVAQQGGAGERLATTKEPRVSRTTSGPVVQRMHTWDELKAYLEHLKTENWIEDHLDSDDKAREIVYLWRENKRGFKLGKKLKNPRIKVLLIREMMEGFTGDEDEQAILEILERSSNPHLSYIFGPDGIKASDLNAEFHWKEWDWLQDFYERRFEGGMKALLSGKVKPKGRPISLGTPLSKKFPEREYEKVEVPTPRALRAASHAHSMLNQTSPRIWFDSWYNDERDNNDDGKVDEEDPGEWKFRPTKEGETRDGLHYEYGKAYPKGARVGGERIPPNSIMYKVCVDVVKESYITGAGVPLITSSITRKNRGVGQIESYCRSHRRLFRTWDKDFPDLVPGDIITCKEKGGCSHSGIVGPDGNIIHLPGPSRRGLFGMSSHNDMESWWRWTWATSIGITQVSRLRR